MDFSITISDNGKYFTGKVYRRLNREVAKQLAKEYLKTINSTGIRLILNDVRGIINEMGIFNGYKYAYEDVISIGLPRNIRAAIVADEGDDSHDFQETVARNTGYDVRVFHSVEQAVEWLMSDKS